MDFSEEHLSPRRLAQIVVERLDAEDHVVTGYFCEIRGDRQPYADALQGSLADAPVAVVIVRNIVFDDPNAVPQQFVDLIERNREDVERQLASLTQPMSRVGVVLLTRAVPNVPQASSPARLPGWFPLVGGRETSVLLRDLTWTGSAPIDCTESAVPAISSRLFALDGALLRRVASVNTRDPSACDSFWGRLGNAIADPAKTGAHPLPSIKDYLPRWDSFRQGVRVDTAFRPDAAMGSTLVALVWKAVQKMSPESVGKIGKGLAKALDLPEPLDAPWHQAFLSALGRPANRPDTARDAFATSLVRAVAASAQFITVAAHADAYVQYPVSLLRSVSLDLRRELADATSLLNHLDQ